MSDDWLYGGRRKIPDPDDDAGDDATRPMARQPKPDETRVMPTVEREPTAPRPAARAPRETPPPPAGSTSTTHGGGLSGVRRWFGRAGPPAPPR
jgi:hypothetical protein